MPFLDPVPIRSFRYWKVKHKLLKIFHPASMMFGVYSQF